MFLHRITISMQHFYQNYVHHGFSESSWTTNFCIQAISGEHIRVAEYLRICWLIVCKLHLRSVRQTQSPLGLGYNIAKDNPVFTPLFWRPNTFLHIPLLQRDKSDFNSSCCTLELCHIASSYDFGSQYPSYQNKAI